jgi:phage major head subunit gpT-like protein
MAGTMRADIAKAMYVGSKEVFKKNLEARKEQEWKSYMTVKTSDKMEEKYETVGNLKPASEKLEGAPIEYGKITDGYTTTIKNKTWANGFQVSMEAKEDDQWTLVADSKSSELVRTIVDLREENAAAVWNEVQTRVSADGKYYADDDHPLLNTTGAK